MGQIGDGNTFGSILGRAAASAAIGGTASSLSGGNFANGAMTGAFSRAFNDEGHDQERGGGGGPTSDYPDFRIPAKYRQALDLINVEAAFDFLYPLNADSAYFDTEFGAIFSKDNTVHTGIPIGDGKIGFQHSGVGFIRQTSGYRFRIVGIDGRFMAHTHGGSGADRHLFSPDDIRISKGGNMPVFMTDYKGDFRVYLPSMSERTFIGITLCTSCVPTAR